MIPFLGTTLGAACVFFVKNSIKPSVHKILLGFASGVMVAASVWSLLIPAMEMSDHLGRFAFIPAVTGLAVGMVFLLLMDKMIPHLHYGSQDPEGPKSGLARTTMLVLAVTLHNIPEGMWACCLQDWWREMRLSLPQEPLRWRWELPFRISLRAQLFPFLCEAAEWDGRELFLWELCPG